MSDAFIAAYQQHLTDQNLLPDAAQQAIVMQLAARIDALAQRSDETAQRSDSIQRSDVLAQRSDFIQHYGAYIVGPVGRGKTMLMDLFFQHVVVHPSRYQVAASSADHHGKLRLHFHHFMRRVHQELAACQGEANPLAGIAKRWAHQYALLCFDEFVVEDIGDAMLLGTLWRELFSHGVMLVATSNAAPAQLYRNGLQRSRFLPAIALLEQHCELLSLDSGIDYRRVQHSDWHWYGVQQANDWLWQRCAELDHTLTAPKPVSTPMTLLGRPLPYLWQHNQLIAFDFMALCSGPRSQLDYIELAKQYRVIALANVPVFLPNADTAILHGVEENYQREHSSVFVSRLDNEARRFIALVDECYEQDCLLVITSQVPAFELYQASQLAFAFERTVSRLFEMQRWRRV